MAEESKIVPLSQLFKEFEEQPPLVELVDGYFIFYDEDRRPYRFEASRADNNAKMLEWIRHLTEKYWVTGLHVWNFILIATEHLPDVKPDYSA